MFCTGAGVVAGVVVVPQRFLLLLFFGASASDDEDLGEQNSMQIIYQYRFLVNESRMLAAANA